MWILGVLTVPAAVIEFIVAPILAPSGTSEGHRYCQEAKPGYVARVDNALDAMVVVDQVSPDSCRQRLTRIGANSFICRSLSVSGAVFQIELRNPDVPISVNDQPSVPCD